MRLSAPASYPGPPPSTATPSQAFRAGEGMSGEPIPGVRNFRDVGGYRTRRGGSTRPARLYRSGELGGAEGQGIAALRERGIRTAVRLASKDEGDARRDAAVAAKLGCSHIDLPMPPFAPRRASAKASRRSDGAIPAKRAERALEMAREMRIRAMTAAYVTLLEDSADVFAQVLHVLTDRDALPAVLYCRLGADRTGLAVALALRAVGVVERDILADYVASNGGLPVDLSLPDMLEQLRRAAPDWNRIDELRGVSAETIQGAFAHIEREYGGTDLYLSERLGLDARCRRDLTANLTLDP